jgi:hypothetical protein
MTKQDYERIVKATREVTERACKDKSSAIAFLQRAGLVDQSGQLAKPYAPTDVQNAKAK